MSPGQGPEGQGPDPEGSPSPYLGDSRVFEGFGDCHPPTRTEPRAPDPEPLQAVGEGWAAGSEREDP